MPRSTLTVKAELLRWARETAGMTIAAAARKLGFTVERLTEWEDSGGHPTPRQLERLAHVYRRSTATFFLPARPVEPKLPIDYRLPVPGAGTMGALSTDLLFTLRRARRLQRAFAELGNAIAPPEAFSLGLSDDPSKSADRARKVLGIKIEHQMALHTPEKALGVWRHALERTGVLVFRFPIAREELRGFSLPGTPPIIVVSTRDYFSSQTFSLFHEWAHLALGEPGMCLPEIGAKATTVGHVERFCNQFAADLLVPKRALLDEEATRNLQAKRLQVMDALRVLERVFAVSRYVVLRRLHTLRVVSDYAFRQADRMLADEYRRKLERERERKKDRKSWGPPPSVTVVSQLGDTFVSQVLDAHERGAIHYADVSDLLAVRVKHIPQIQELVAP
jgi:Zn-dependent peptidase ImmA (M78 family)